MAQLGNWFSRVFSNDGTRGLSGDASFIAGEQGRGGFFASRLRLHTTADDLVERSELLWELSSRGRRRGGLLHHLSSEQGDGVAGFTDLMLVINRSDWERAELDTGDFWRSESCEQLLANLREWCKQTQFNQVFPDRGFQISLVADGSEALRGHSIGLEPGQFVTALLPNAYRGPLSTSSPVLAVHLNIPGAWEGYRKVGMLYSDQLCYTLGNHWLDNFTHEALEAPALYQLQQYPDGSLVHVINPDYQSRFEVGSVQSAEGPSVLAVTERGGAPVAFLVLGVVDTFLRDPSVAPEAPVEPTSGTDKSLRKNSELTRIKAPEAAPAPAEERPAAVRMAGGSADDFEQGPVKPEQPPSRVRPKLATSPRVVPRASGSGRVGGDRWHHTIVPDAVEERIFTLKERGALLQRVHFSVFMEGYDVFVSRSGQLGTSLPDPEALFQVREDKVYFVARTDRVLLAGRPAPVDKAVRMRGEIEIRVANQLLEYRDLSGVAAEGWPYLGEIRRTAGSTYLVFGTVYRIGRDRRCKVRLPDEPHNDNLCWRMDLGEGDFIRSRTGDIPKSRFYNDSIMVASLHAEIDLEGEPMLRNLARHCYSFVRRDQDVFSLHPARDEKGLRHLDLLPGDEVMVGNNLFEVSYPPPRTPEVEKLTADALARAALSLPDDSFVDEPLDEIDIPESPEPTPEPARSRPVPLEPRPAPPEPDVAAATGRAALDAADAQPDPEPAQPDPRPGRPEPAPAPAGPAAPAPRAEAAPPSPPAPKPEPRVETAPPAPEPATPAPPAPPADEDAPVAAGLGELGPAPDGVSFTDPGFDSILGIEAPVPKHLRDTPSVVKPAPRPVLPATQPPERAPGREPSTRPTSSIPQGDTKPLPKRPEPVDLGSSPRPAATRPRVPRPATDEVVAVDEGGWQLALSRPGRLQQLGWMVSGRVLVGNHRAAHVVIPENRTASDQRFEPRDYFRMNVRGGRGTVQRLDERDARAFVGDLNVESINDLANLRLEISRRDDLGDEDFVVHAALRREAWLPDPRAQLLALDLEDRLVAALFTRGFPLRAAIPVRLGPIDCIATYDAGRLLISDYLDAYAYPDGSFQPFFHRSGEARFRTAPEDGSGFELRDGDMLIAGRSVYRFEDA
jgi:hypothetical protein